MKAHSKAVLITVGACLVAVASVRAVPVMRIDDGAGLVLTIFDNGALDSNPTLGAVTWIGPAGSASTGISTRLAGDPGRTVMDLSCILGTAFAGPVTIWFSDDSFQFGTGEFRLSAAGELLAPQGSTAAFGAFADASNTLLAATTPAGFLGAFASGAFSGESSGSTGPLFAPYSVTMSAVLTGPLNVSFQSTLRDWREQSQVPDSGASLILLLLSLAAVSSLSAVFGRPRVRG